MSKVTAQTITITQIQQLSTEAGAAGDSLTVSMCDDMVKHLRKHGNPAEGGAVPRPLVSIVHQINKANEAESFGWTKREISRSDESVSGSSSPFVSAESPAPVSVFRMQDLPPGAKV